MREITSCWNWLRLFAPACVTALLLAQRTAPERPFRDVSRPEDAARVEWLSKNELPIRSIDPEDDNFVDLAALKKILGDARVVQLGEQSHGDGATFYAKQRLIRFLHEEMGFDVLAWESGFFDCEEMNGELASDKPILRAALRGVYGIWTRGALMAPVFEYTRSTLKTSRPLHHTGFDIQGAHLGYVKRLFEFADAVDPKLGDERDTIARLLTAMGGQSYQPSREEREKGRTALNRVLEGLRRGAPTAKNSRESIFFSKSIENLLALEELRSKGASDPGYRDGKMGENLVWLANEFYRGRKIIVWAASMHVVRNVETISRQSNFIYRGLVTMGDVVRQQLGTAAYTIAFTAYRGQAGNPQTSPHSLASPSPESIETLLHAAGKPYALVNFRELPPDHWLRTPMLSRPLGYVEMLSNWTDNFDAMFYTDAMFPNTTAGTVPDGVRTKKE
jgi:erythromycin esterase